MGRHETGCVEVMEALGSKTPASSKHEKRCRKVQTSPRRPKMAFKMQ